ncbi:MAG: sulfite reductase flavoprotein subunit alpha [Acidobacteriota bacterium]
MQSEQTATLEAGRIAWSRNNPYTATVLENRLLTGPGSEKETRHIELDLGDSGMEYLPGDSAGILPLNACDAVDLVLERLQLTGQEPVTDFYGKPLDLRQALSSWLMIGKLSGTTLKAWAKHTGNPELSEIAGNKEKLDAYLWGREFLDLLEKYPATVADPQQLFKILPRLAPRLYSISSSQALLGNQIDLSIRVVKYESHGRARFGVCSTHVGERTPKGGQLPIFIHSNQLFRLPADPDVRVIMVGPGTGVAPFRAYLQHKQAGQGRWPMWLFFGDQRYAQDFLYREDFEHWLENGVLDRLDTAFSRDQAHKIYVQDRIRENSAELWRWLDEGAYFYVCGDSKRMAPDVEKALLEAIATHSGKGPDYANEFLAEMKKQKRYLRDVY